MLYSVEGGEEPAGTLLNLAVERIADQAASYMVAGFVHGVLNTDNINITGESFDYGPWRFTPEWDPRFTAAYFDHDGLYAFGRQAEAMHWNLGQLAVSLRLICEAPPLIAALERFPALYQAAVVRRFLWRLGVLSQGEDSDRSLVEAAERAMVTAKIPIDLLFHTHRGGRGDDVLSSMAEYEHFLSVLAAYTNPAAVENPYWQGPVPCSMYIEEVETIWAAIAEQDDWTPLAMKIAAIRDMGQALQW
jgi:serine/tyrosine/threonine adenylyltransferase